MLLSTLQCPGRPRSREYSSPEGQGQVEKPRSGQRGAVGNTRESKGLKDRHQNVSICLSLAERIWVIFYFSSLCFSVLFEFFKEQRACIIFIIRKKELFSFCKNKKKRHSGLIDSDPVLPLTSCQEQLSGKYVYLESEKSNPFLHYIIGI